MTHPTIRNFENSDATWIAEEHQQLYARDEGFDASFGALVADIVHAFIHDHDPARERGWVAEADGRPVGCIFCVAATEETAKLRLFLLLPEARGLGLGKRLLRQCMDFARSSGYRDMRLWTHESHRAACALYASFGWTLTESKPVHSFGVDLIEQAWRIDL